MDANNRTVGFDVNGALANSKSNLISLLQPYQSPSSRGKVVHASTRHVPQEEVYGNDDSDYDEDDGEDDTKGAYAVSMRPDNIAPHVQREIDRIYERRGNSPLYNDEYITSAQSSRSYVPISQSNSESTKEDVVIQRAYVRPTKQPPAEPVLSELEIMKANLAPPLPLMRFNAMDEKEVATAHTITGEKIPTIANLLEASTYKKSTPLCDPVHSRKITKWFIKRSFKELNWRQQETYSTHFSSSTAASGGAHEDKPDVQDHTVYESLLYAESLADRRARDASRPTEEQIFQERWDRMASVPSGTSGHSPATGSSPSMSASTSRQDLSNMNSGASMAAVHAHLSHPGFTPSLRFDSEFESGNLEKAVRVIGRESLLSSSRTTESTGPDPTAPGEVDQEYDLTLRKDINTEGNIQWYYFAVTAGAGQIATERSNSTAASSSTRSTPLPTSRAGLGSRATTPLGPGQGQGQGQGAVGPAIGASATPSGRNTPCIPQGGMVPVKYPLRVRFNIVNMQKKDSLYNYGMMPATYSENQSLNEDWVHRGEDVCYYRNGATTVKSGKRGDESKKKMLLQYHYTLTFTYTFEQPDTVYFAHTFPYTYSDLQLSLCKMEQKYRNSGFFHQRTLCETLAGNSCDILSISERSQGIIESKNKPAVILTARVHPGESNSSFMIQGFLDFITSDAPEAVKLRQSFVFHVIPMLNPDGVIHGNYRCSLAATDLNRRYAAPHPKLHPTILAKKNFLLSTAKNRSILLYLDLHGHSKLKNAFMYGCDITFQPDKITKQIIPLMSAEDVMQRRVFSRVFPRVLSAVSNSTQNGYFSYRDCNFAVNKGKSGTGRVVCWKEVSILASYTIEASFCGNGDNKESALFKKAAETTSVYSRTALATPSAHPAGMRRGSSVAVLPRSRQDSGASQAPLATAGGGIAYFSNAATTPVAEKQAEQGENAEGAENVFSGDEEAINKDKQTEDAKKGFLEGASSKGSRKKVTKKAGPARTTLRKSSSAALPVMSNLPALPLPAQQPPRETTPTGPTADADSAMSELLERYHSFVHYRKEDLLNMGRDIGLAIYHYANLSHSDIDNELRIATQADAEAKIRANRLNQLGYKSGRSGKSTPDLSDMSGKIRRRKTLDQKGDVEESGREDSHKGHLKSAAWAGVWSNSGDSDPGDQSYPGVEVPAEGDFDLDCLDCVLQPVVHAHHQASAEAAEQGGAEEVELDMEVYSEGEDEEVCSDSEDASEDRSGANSSTGFLSPPRGGTSDLVTLMKDYTTSKVRTMEIDMAERSLLRAGVFSAAALETAMQAYPMEFLDEQASYNVGMRMKCEYSIRRGLRCAGNITLTHPVLQQHEAACADQVEEDCLSTDGSDSNPSVDNVPAVKMLRNIKRFKDTSGLVLALRKAAIRKKRKELESERKLKKKEAKKLARQASDARRALDEARSTQAAKDAKNAAELAAQHQAAATAMATQIAENLKEKVSRRKSSIFQSAPKHAPLYRLAPDELKLAPQPLPMKVVNFKDYDLPEDGGPVPGRSRKGSESFNEQQQPLQYTPQAGGAALALSMTTLTTAVNKLYFGAVEEPEVFVQAPIPSSIYIQTSTTSGTSPSVHPSRRKSTFINTNMQLPSVNSAEAAPAAATAPLFTATSIRREGSPRSLAAAPTVHNMNTITPNTAEPLQRVRERHVTEDDYGIPRTLSSDRSAPVVGRVRPKSGSATSRRRVI